ncbi:dioxygenase family protein [Actinomadura roseirufa]|uniref:dioxygenase family protein n=1 Tax=Actinomadura roseirufa TaxID=2094049 RepID=UPI0010412313|nr:dioxygenase [Actinomadura roseirufa]
MAGLTGADFSEHDATGVVTASFAGTPDARLREVLDALVRHLHAFVRETRPTSAEWQAGIGYLTATGLRCDDARQEFVLLSDVLGVSMLVESINNRKAGDATEATVLGPFHVVGSPARPLGADIAGTGTAETAVGEECVVTGRVVAQAPDGTSGPGLAGATVDVWQAGGDGLYDVQAPGERPEGHLRGLFTTDADGRFWFRTVVPSSYSIPDDGPVGALLRASGRHPHRPAHVHVIAAAPGHVPVTTQVFVAGDPYLGSDAVFGVRRSLIRAFDQVDDRDRAAEYGVSNPFRHAHFDVVLQPVDPGPGGSR